MKTFNMMSSACLSAPPTLNDFQHHCVGQYNPSQGGASCLAAQHISVYHYSYRLNKRVMDAGS